MEIKYPPLWHLLRSLALFAVLAITFSCSDEESARTSIIHPNARDLVDLFIEEAGKRDVQLDLTGLRVEFTIEVEFNGSSFCGYAFSTSPNALIRISQPCWDRLTDYEKEILMFHELGHALLFRPHLDAEYDNGSKVSMMHSDACCMYNQWTLNLRDYYIDELFGTHEGPPDWAVRNENSRVVFEENFESIGSWELTNNLGESPAPHITGALDSARSWLELRSSDNTVSENSHYWRLRLEDLDIAPDSELELRARVRGQDISGEGIVVSMRGDAIDVSTSITFDLQLIEEQGDFGFQRVNLRIPYYTSAVDRLTIFFVMRSNTSGTAYLTDLELVEWY
ncbi:MAG: hypothetical protein RIC80_11875 [Cyclobacteriaceae bacterium]